MDISLNANLIGIQLGYQFIFWNRMTIDLVMMGPGGWFYGFNSKLSTDLSSADEELLFSKINEFIDNKIPGNDFLIQPGGINRKGSSTSSSKGFRYVVHLGFRF